MKKRLLSAFLAVMMVLTMAPVAFAADETNTSVDSYEKLVQAIESAADGATITLSSDIDVTQTIAVKDKAITLNLNGKKLYNTNDLWDKPDAKANNWSLISVRGTGDLTITGNGTLSAKENDCYDIDVQDKTASVTIEDGTFVGNIHTVYVEYGAAYIKGGSYSILQKYPTAALADEFVLNCLDEARAIGDAKIVVSGGRFDGFNPANCKAEAVGTNFCAESYTTSQDGTTYTVIEGENTAVANAGANYNTVADAITAMTAKVDKGTVTLLKDTTEDVVIPANKDITLDLNGHKLTNVSSDTITITKGATLTMQGKGTVDNVTHQKAAIYNNGTTILNGGIYDRSKENGKNSADNGGNSFYAVLNHGTMEINEGATVYQNGHYSSLLENGYQNAGSNNERTGYVQNVNAENPTLTINGGLFTGGLNTVKNDDNGIITIQNGTFTNVTQAAFQNHNIATINGGTFDGANVNAILNCGTTCSKDTDNDKHQLTITGGNFNGKIYKGGDSKDGTHYDIGSISITGGYFTDDPSEYCGVNAEGKQLTGIKNNDPTYLFTVGEKAADAAPVETATVPAQVDGTATPDTKAAAEEMTEGADLTQNNVIEAAVKDTANKNDIKADTKIGTQTVNEKLNKATNTTVDADNVQIVYQTYVDVKVSEAEKTNNDYTKLAVDLTPMYRVIATTKGVYNSDTDYVVDADGNKNGVNAIQVTEPKPLTLPDKEYDIKLALPTDFAHDNVALSVKHTKNGGAEFYKGITSKENGKLYVNFTTKGFSPFEITKPAATITDTGMVYPTLKDAVDNVGPDGTITLFNNIATNDVATVAKNIKFTVVTNGKTFDKDKNIIAGNNTTVEVAAGSGTVGYQFTYTQPSSSGGSSSGKTTYKVTTSAVNNGGVNASPSTAEKGATITVTLSPDKGYKLGKLTVTDGSGKTVSTTKKSDTVYTFTMPASAVTVGVSYVKADETPSETKFNDVSANDWFASAVDYVTGKGMMNGTAANTFSPKANTTRGMVVTVLYRLEKEPSTSAASFTDVASGAYYANAVAWANANGIVSGYGNGKFGPNDKVTREQLAAILYRYAQYKKYDVSVGENTNILSYEDVQSVSTYAIPALQWACGAGVVTGKTGNKLDPKGNATRAEVAAMLMRFCENVAK